MTIERKKNKKGEYDYFIADNNGKVVRKLKDYFNGMQFEYFWAFSHYRTTPEEEQEEKIVVDSGWGGEDSYVKDIRVTTGGEEKEVLVLLDNNGDVIFDGIKEIHKYYFDFKNDDGDGNGFLIVSIDPEFDFKNDLINKFLNSFEYNHKLPVYCVIGLDGTPQIKATHNYIFFDSQKKIFFDSRGDKMGKF